MSLPNPGMNFTAFDVLPAADLNDMVANIEALADGSGLDDGAVTADKLGLGGQSADVVTGQSTTSTSFTNLTTSGPAVTVTVPTSGKVLLSFTARLRNSDVNGGAAVGVNVTGANTIAPEDDVYNISSTASADNTGSFTKQLTGLTPGSTTFTLQYRRQGGTTATFARRNITVIPLG